MIPVLSLNRVLWLYLSLVALVPLVLFGAVLNQSLTRVLGRDAHRATQLLAIDIRDEVRQFLQRPATDLRRLEQQMGPRPFSQTGGSFNRILDLTVATTDYFEFIGLISSSGELRHLGMQSELQGNRATYRGIDLSSRMYWHDKPPAGQTKLHWSDVELSLISGQPVIYVSYSLDEGEMIGLVLLGRLTQLVQKMSGDGVTQFALVDRKGGLIAHSDRTQVERRVNYHFHPEIIEAQQMPGDGEAVLSHNDGERFESVAVMPETGWAVWVARNRDLALLPVARMRQLLIACFGAATLACLLLSLWLARRLLRPLQLLTSETHRLADGDYDFSLAPRSYQEFNLLIDDFRSMATAIFEREGLLQQSRRRFQDLVEAIDGIVWEFELKSSSFTFVSRKAEHILGYPVDEWLDNPGFLADHLHPDDRDWVLESQSLFLGQPKNFELDFRILTADGKIVWLHYLATIRMEDGKPAGLQGVMVDISRRRTAEESLRESEQRLRSFYDLDLIGMVIVDAELNWLQVNRAFCRMLDYAGAELPPLSWNDLVHHDDRERQREELVGVLSGTREGFELEQRMLRRDGEIIHVHLALRAVRGDSGEIRQLLVLVQDITERIMLQQQNVRTAQLAALGELAAGVAHEINNPLTGVINYAQILVNRLPGGEESDIAGRIIKEGERVATIVRNLLYYARDEKPQQSLVELPRVIDEALTLTRAQIAKEGITLKLEIADSLPPVRASSQQLQQLLLNLVSNARYALNQKYPQGGEVEKCLEISVGSSPDNPGRFLRLTVFDKGIGIPPALLQRSIQPFVTTKPAGLGTGLGLSISREIAAKHGGRFWLESEEGDYTKAILELPSVGGDNHVS